MKKLIILLLFLAIYKPPVAFASSLDFSLSPSLITIKTNGPEEIVKEVRIKNYSDHNVSYSIAIIPFTPSPLGNGEPIFQDKVDQEYNTLFQNIDLIQDGLPIDKVDLAPNQEKVLKLILNPQSTIPDKDYYFSVVFTSKADETKDTSAVRIEQAGAINVLFSYGAQSAPEGIIKEFSAPSLTNKGPVRFKITVKNTSHNFINAKGNIRIINMFGQTVGSFELEPANILSNSERVFDNSIWNEKFLLGFYSVEAQVSLSPSGPLLTKELKFFAFPTQLLMLAIFVGLFMLYLGFRINKKRSRS